jgi:hypothetical protein
MPGGADGVAAVIYWRGVLGCLAWFFWLAAMTAVLTWGIRDFRRGKAWYSACLAAAAALHIMWMGSMAVWSIVLRVLPDGHTHARTVGPGSGSPPWIRVLSDILAWAGTGAFLLGTLLLIVGGLALYVAYPQGDPAGPGRAEGGSDNPTGRRH